MKAAVYCRLSFDPGGKSIGLETQENDGRAKAAELGAEVVAVHVDDDISAASAEVRRPAFEEVVTGVLAGDYDLVVAWDQSRLTRNATDLERLLLAVKTTGAQLWTVRGGRIDTDSPEGRAVSRIVNVMDALYVEAVQVKTIRAMQARAEKGLPLSGTAGFGYAKDPASDNYVVVEDEAHEIKTAAARVLDGWSLARVAADWNDRGVARRRPGRYSASSVRRILLSPRVAGQRVHRGKVVGSAAWPAIVDEVTHARLARVLTDPRRRTANSRSAALLTGIVECDPARGGCGNTLNHKWTHGKAKYYCRHCGSRTVAAEDFEEFVRGLVVDFIDHTALDSSPAEDDTAQVFAELDDVNDRLATLAAAWATGGVGTDEWQAARSVLTARQKALRARLDTSAPEPLVAHWAGSGTALDEAWPVMDPTAKRRLVRATFRWVRLGPAVQGLGRFDPDRVTFEYAG